MVLSVIESLLAPPYFSPTEHSAFSWLVRYSPFRTHYKYKHHCLLHSCCSSNILLLMTFLRYVDLSSTTTSGFSPSLRSAYAEQTMRWEEVSRLPPGWLPSQQWGHWYWSFLYFPFMLHLVSIMFVSQMNSIRLFSNDFCFMYNCIFLVSWVRIFTILLRGSISSLISFRWWRTTASSTSFLPRGWLHTFGKPTSRHISSTSSCFLLGSH